MIKTDDMEAADLILANTCAIRENAEQKVWNRLHYFNSLKEEKTISKRKKKISQINESSSSRSISSMSKLDSRSISGFESGPIIGILGYMEERLKREAFGGRRIQWTFYAAQTRIETYRD